MDPNLPPWLNDLGRTLLTLQPGGVFAAWCLWAVNWRRLWPVLAAVVAAIAFQVLLPDRLTAGPAWMLPMLEGMLLIVLVVAFPSHVKEEHRGRRKAALAMTALVSLANLISLVLLARELLRHASPNGRQLLIAGALIWLTNATAFSPTDTMPLTATAKSLMGLQSLISLVTIGLIVARAVNILH